MTREERENAIRHIETAIDLDPWAQELAVKALQAVATYDDGYADGMRAAAEHYILCKDGKIEQIKALYEDTENGAADEFTRGWKRAVDACIMILLMTEDGKE